MKIVFLERGWEDYLWFQENETKLLKKLNRLITECVRTPYEGLGKPEPLKYDRQGYWSRRIDEYHRLVYTLEGDALIILSCRLHYNN